MSAAPGRSAAWPYDTPQWRRLRKEILARDGWRCQIRGAGCEGRAGVVDHIIPWRAGGAVFDPENLRAACAHCNGSRVWRPRVRRPSREW